MSETWLCSDTNLNRKVVIKTIKPGIAKSKLLDELGALSAIRSKHVVQVLDVIHDKSGEISGFVEEFVDGTSLSCEPVTGAAAAMGKLYPIACGVADIHAHKRLHRDLKPENMKLDGEGTLKVFDFGLAKLEGGGGTSVLYFTEGYTAPEAFIKDSSGKYVWSYALDVFAFGAIALWLLNEGKLPPEFSTIPSSVPAVGCDFSTLGCALPKAVSDVLTAALAPDPAMRPTMQAIKETLKRHLLLDRHRMLLTFGGKDYWLDASNRTSNLTFYDAGLTIHYDGLDFTVTSVTGFAQINNRPAATGTRLSGAAVIVLNASNGRRASITADVSHPEVMA